MISDWGRFFSRKMSQKEPVLMGHFAKGTVPNPKKGEKMKTLIIFAHTFWEDSKVNKALFESIKNLKQVQELLDKNAFEIGIWWFSKEKEELQKALNESLQ